MRIISVLVLGMLVPLTSLASEDFETKSAMTKYFDAVRIYDASVMSSLMHPEALSVFRNTIDKALHGNKQDLAKQELLPLFSVSNLSEYTELTDMEVYQRLNETIARTQPDLINLMESSKFEFVSEAARGDVVYVTYTLTIDVDERAVSKDVVQKLKKHDGRWLLLLPADGEASIAGIDARYN